MELEAHSTAQVLALVISAMRNSEGQGQTEPSALTLGALAVALHWVGRSQVAYRPGEKTRTGRGTPGEGAPCRPSGNVPNPHPNPHRQDSSSDWKGTEGEADFQELQIFLHWNALMA